MAEEGRATRVARRYARQLTLLGAASLLVAGCWRRGEGDAGRFGSSEGMRYYAEAVVIGANRDTVRVMVSGRNITRKTKHLPVGGGCVLPGDDVHVVASDGTHRWDSEAWRQWYRDSVVMPRILAMQRTRRDSARTLELGEVCLAYLVARIVPAGDSVNIESKLIPVADILGDSLPPGRYRLRVSFGGVAARSIGGTGGGMRSDEVELR